MKIFSSLIAFPSFLCGFFVVYWALGATIKDSTWALSLRHLHFWRRQPVGLVLLGGSYFEKMPGTLLLEHTCVLSWHTIIVSERKLSFFQSETFMLIFCCLSNLACAPLINVWFVKIPASLNSVHLTSIKQRQLKYKACGVAYVFNSTIYC